MKKGTVHLGSAHSTARLLGHAAQPPWAFRSTSDKTEEGKIPLVAGGSPAKSVRPAAVGRWESGLGVTLVDNDPDLGRWAVGGCCRPKPLTGVDRQHESREAQSLYPSALQLARALRLEFVGCAT
jgi:hypothetical protein